MQSIVAIIDNIKIAIGVRSLYRLLMLFLKSV